MNAARKEAWSWWRSRARNSKRKVNSAGRSSSGRSRKRDRKNQGKKQGRVTQEKRRGYGEA